MISTTLKVPASAPRTDPRSARFAYLTAWSSPQDRFARGRFVSAQRARREYELGSNHREIHGRFGWVQVEGVGDQSDVREMATDWLNLGDRVGYVVRRVPSAENVVRYHDQAQGSGRVPKLQEWLSLLNAVAVEETAAIGADDTPLPDQWACIVTYLNQPAEETERCTGEVSFRARGDVAICDAPIGAGPGFADNSGTSRIAVRVDVAAGLVKLDEGKR